MKTTPPLEVGEYCVVDVAMDFQIESDSVLCFIKRVGRTLVGARARACVRWRSILGPRHRSCH